MANFLVGLAFTVTVAMASHQIHAAEPDDRCALHGGRTVASSEVLRRLWTWVGSEMGVEGPEPVVCVVDLALVSRMGGSAQSTTNALEVLALYDRENRLVLMSSSPDVSDPVAQSVVVHEFVHHAQTLRGERFACPQMAERHAYDMQARWLAGYDKSLAADIGIGGLALVLLTNCPI